MHSIEYSREARKTMKAMPRNVSRLAESKVAALARDPFGAANVKKRVGGSGYRLRVGDWRVIYGARGGVY